VWTRCSACCNTHSNSVPGTECCSPRQTPHICNHSTPIRATRCSACCNTRSNSVPGTQCCRSTGVTPHQTPHVYNPSTPISARQTVLCRQQRAPKATACETVPQANNPSTPDQKEQLVSVQLPTSFPIASRLPDGMCSGAVSTGKCTVELRCQKQPREGRPGRPGPPRAASSAAACKISKQKGGDRPQLLKGCLAAGSLVCSRHISS
jgi:hypothetical protein